MNLPLGVDLLAETELTEPVATPRKDLSEVLLLWLRFRPALDLLGMDAHLFCPGWLHLRLFILLLSVSLKTFMSGTHFIHL